jgi:hypothetical protein
MDFLVERFDSLKCLHVFLLGILQLGDFQTAR